MKSGNKKNILRTIAHFELIDVLGEGGMGTVYLARDTKKNRMVALKLLAGNAEPKGSLAQRFKRECMALSKVRHPNLVRIYEAGRVGKRLYYTMEAISGKSLDSLVRDKGALPLRKAMKITRDLALALVCVHENDLLHRDVKPANVLIEKSGRTILTDFGLVKVQWMDSITQSNTFLGTYQYASPEVLAGLPPDPRSDVYQVGLLFYIMLTGELFPFGETLVEVARRIMVERLVSPSVLRPEIPAVVDDCVMKAIARDPEARYPSAQALADALAATSNSSEAISVEKPVAVAKQSTLSRVAISVANLVAPQESEERSRNPLLSTIGVHLLLTVAMICFVFTLTLRWKQQPGPRVSLPVAMTWIRSDWDAVSFRWGNEKALERPEELYAAIGRLRDTDTLLRAVNSNLPVLITCELQNTSWPDFLARAIPALELARACQRFDIEYENPVRETIVEALRTLAEQLVRQRAASPKGLNKAKAMLQLWHKHLMENPAFDVRCDKTFKLLSLPSSNILLSHARALLECADGADSRKQHVARFSPAKDEDKEGKAREQMLERIFSPLTTQRTP